METKDLICLECIKGMYVTQHECDLCRVFELSNKIRIKELYSLISLDSLAVSWSDQKQAHV